VDVPHCLLQVWRGEHYACSHSEYLQVKRQLMSESHAAARDAEGGEAGSSGARSWQQLSSEEQGKLLKERLKKYTQKVRAHRSRLFGPWHSARSTACGLSGCLQLQGSANQQVVCADNSTEDAAAHSA
jgi:hypothetical protein